MAKAALETAVLDAELRARGQSLAGYLGATQTEVPCGVSVGIMDTLPALLDAVAGYLAEGYRRVKLKIEPGWDVEPVRAVRERFGDDLLLVLFISHNLSVVRYISDEVAVMYLGRVVETAPVDRVVREPAHPYTRVLLEAVPRLDVPLDPAPPDVDSEPPDPHHPPSGCHFHPRCPVGPRARPDSTEWPLRTRVGSYSWPLGA